MQTDPLVMSRADWWRFAPDGNNYGKLKSKEHNGYQWLYSW